MTQGNRVAFRVARLIILLGALGLELWGLITVASMYGWWILGLAFALVAVNTLLSSVDKNLEEHGDI